MNLFLQHQSRESVIRECHSAHMSIIDGASSTCCYCAVCSTLRPSIHNIIPFHAVQLILILEEQLWHVCVAVNHQTIVPLRLHLQLNGAVVGVANLLHCGLLTVGHFLIVVYVSSSTLPILVDLNLDLLTLAVFPAAACVAHFSSFFRYFSG